jgi:tetratricopeptide (TPR) repeat protein
MREARLFSEEAGLSRSSTMRFILLTMAMLATSCRERAARHEEKPLAKVAAPEPALPPISANDPGIALGNFDGQIKGLEERANDRAARLSLVDMLSARGQYLGRIADYEKALTIAEELVKELPDAAALSAHAAMLATFHKFPEALAELAEAEKHGLNADRLAAARASIFSAQGKYQEALALSPKDESSMTAMQLATAGILAGEMGKLPEAERLLNKAREKYPDVSPFPLAWMDVQQAKLYEAHGLREKARRHYERALILLPPYAVAASHLAAMSDPKSAIEILGKANRADDPEVLVQLADAQRRAGLEKEAQASLDAAIARYDVLTKAHPEAFADHAAVMWLGPGRDAQKALSFAKVNASIRTTSESIDLLLTAATAAKNDVEACAAAKSALALPYPSEDLKTLASSVMKRCPAH